MENAEIEKEIIAEKKSISNLYRFLLIFLFIVVVVFSLFYYSNEKHATRIMVDASVFDVRLQNMENSITAHEKRIAGLEESGGKTNNAAVESRVPAEAKIPEEVNKRIETLDKEIKTLKSSYAVKNRQETIQAIRLISTFNRLSRMITLGKPFSAELSAFLDMYGADNDKSLEEVVAALIPYSDSGIPTQAALLDSFDDTVEALDNSPAAAPENAGFWQTVLFNLSHMITIRKIDKTQTGNSQEAVIGRAYDYLDNGENEAAVAEIKSLPDSIRNHFSAWLEEAQMVSLAPSLMDDLDEKVMKKAFAGQDADSKNQKPEDKP